MDWFPLWNSLRVAAISTVIIFFAGIFAAYYIARLPRLLKGVLDVVLTLPLVLPHGHWLSAAAPAGAEADHRCLAAEPFRREGGHDLVVRHLCHRRGDLSADVPHGPGGL